MKKKVVFLIGRPNVGKSTIFNAILGKKSADVGNWEGATVSVKKGYVKEIEFVDTPGVDCIDNLSLLNAPLQEDEDSDEAASVLNFSMSDITDEIKKRSDASYLSEDQAQTMRMLRNERCDMILHVGEMNNILGTILLSLQLSGMNKPMILLVNKEDLRDRLERDIDFSKLSQLLGVKIIPHSSDSPSPLADKVISASRQIWSEMPETQGAASKEKTDIHSETEGDLVNRAIEIYKACTVERKNKKTIRIFDTLDHLLLHRTFGFAFFGLVSYLLFAFTIKASEFFEPIIDFLIQKLIINTISVGMTYLAVPGFLIDMFHGGIGLGIRMVSSFVPIIFFLYGALVFLEESGYMSRASILTRSVMKRFGLPGKGAISLILSLGCNVNGILSSRTISDKKQRIALILISPFITCSARFSVFIVLCSAFYKDASAWVIFALYIMGLIVAMSFALLLKYALKLKVDNSLLIMKMPDYRLPDMKSILIYSSMRAKAFVKTTSKVIIPLAVIFNLYLSNNDIDKVKKLSSGVTAITKYMGVGEENWEASLGLLAGAVSKEMILGTTGSLYLVQENIQRSAKNGNKLDAAWWKEELKKSFAENDVEKGNYEDLIVHRNFQNKFQSKLAAFSYLVFILLYFPCVSVFAVTKGELGLGYAIFSAAFCTLFAYAVSVLIYQCGSLFFAL